MAIDQISELLSIPHTYDPIAKKLTIPNLDSFPSEILDFAKEIEILDLSHGHLTSLPKDFGKLDRLRVLFMSHNDFTEVPAVLATCPTLQTIGMASCKISIVTDLPATLEALILTNNEIEQLPASLGNLTALRKLTLTGNRLRELPSELLKCSSLELIRIPVNEFGELPNWLFELPNLAWYAEAGNPGSPTTKPIIQTIDWSDVDLGEKLGESSKNIVYKAILRSTNQAVAVKVFGGGISADGNPADEIIACLGAPSHPALIQTIADVSGAPDSKKRLVMNRIPDDYVSLGKPPTLQTVTRDTYTPDTTFTLPFILHVLHDIASALSCLHQKDLMHGDVYAHNILVNRQGQAILADLGAASFYEPTASNYHELIEAKAFGHLASELLARCSPAPDTLAHNLIAALAAKCLLPTPADRPTFAEISTAIVRLLEQDI